MYTLIKGGKRKVNGLIISLKIYKHNHIKLKYKFMFRNKETLMTVITVIKEDEVDVDGGLTDKFYERVDKYVEDFMEIMG